MARARSGARLSWPLVILCGVLAFVLYLSRNADPRVPPAPQVAAEAEIALAEDEGPPNEFELRPIVTYAETINRPLFEEDRRQPQDEPAAETPVAEDKPAARPSGPPRPAMTLSGIVISPEGRFALIAAGRGGPLRRIVVGDEVDGWRVDRIEPDRVVLQGDQGSETYELKDRLAEPRKPRRARSEPAPPRPASAEPEAETKPAASED